ncbi:MAG: hypothetical protein DWQ49_11095 [Bacteroidetes bacterium]|nr:MAG: hypothetical protein DWQ49_11095 [Bacteroidota bacterium]
MLQLQQKQFDFKNFLTVSLEDQLDTVCNELDNLKNPRFFEDVEPKNIDEDFFKIAMAMMTPKINENEGLFNKGTLWELAINYGLGMPLDEQLSTSSRSNMAGSTSYDIRDKHGKKIEIKTRTKLINPTKKPKFFTAIERNTHHQGDWTTVKDGKSIWYCKSDARDVLKSAKKYPDLFITQRITILNGNSSKQKLKAFQVVEDYSKNLGWNSMYIIQTPLLHNKTKNEIKEIHTKLVIYEVKKEYFIKNAFFITANNNIDFKMIYNPEFVKCIYSKSIKDIDLDQAVEKKKREKFVRTYLEKIGNDADFIEAALQ